MGKVRGQCSHKHHDYRSQTKFPHKTHSFPTASSSCQDFQAQSTEPKTLHSILPGKEHNQGTSRSSIPVLFESFPCTKKANSFRPVINLSQLNLLLNVLKFKMEFVPKIALCLLEPYGHHCSSKDAFFHLLIAWESHKYFAFEMDSKIYVFQFWPFGLSPALGHLPG